MAVFRIEKTRDYTVMSNHHLRDKSLSLKAKGLLSLMLSLPEEWDYTTKGLARICKDGVDSICAGVRELEEHGYVIRQRVRNPNGQLGAIEYTILEQPRPPEPKPQKPERENPVLDNPEQASPVLEEPEQGNPAQLNTNRSSKEKSKKDLSSTEGSNPVQSSPQTPRGSDRKGRDRMRERESYRELILENIEYDILVQNERLDRDRLDELVELMVDTVCSNREMIRIAGDDYPAEVVKNALDALIVVQKSGFLQLFERTLLFALFQSSGQIGIFLFQCFLLAVRCLEELFVFLHLRFHSCHIGDIPFKKRRNLCRTLLVVRELHIGEQFCQLVMLPVQTCHLLEYPCGNMVTPGLAGTLATLQIGIFLYHVFPILVLPLCQLFLVPQNLLGA